MELFRFFVSTAPDLRDFRQDKPTLLVSWWCTGYAITIIFFRVFGRYVRTEKVYVEDAIMMLAIIPLLVRAAFVHVILLYGTNNTQTLGLSELEIHHRETGSQLVLASRIMYTAYLWAIKYSVSMYLRSLTESVWQRSHQRLLRYLHIFLAVTFVATVIGDLAACQPFSHYWQVVPDPGPQCRQGYAALFTMGVMNIITNIALIVFPIPMILRSSLPQKRKISIILRMGLPLLGIVLTLYQIPMVINRHGGQQFRSLVASFDILVATFTSNAVVLGSLLQDRGYKKEKYKFGAAGRDFNTKRTDGGARRPTTRWGSDEDLMRPGDSLTEDGKEGSGKGVVIGLRELDVDGKKSTEVDKPDPPPKAKFPEIRVASTWEIKVVDRNSKAKE